ncbi:MAG: 3-hydroxyacyl-CoA dehydrogenase family protein [bacterium]|nr:3-hydroxyacyl-CoA dehydrogenase family protein [bacterium]
MDVKKIGVVGLGTMGSNIALVCARGGADTVACEMDAPSLEEGMNRVRSFLDAGVQKGKSSPGERDATLGRLKGTAQLTDLAGCDLVIEAIHEDMPEKEELFRRLGDILSPAAILATNTSTLSVTELAAASGRPPNVIGTHFCLPAALNKMVEVAPGLLTSKDTTAATLAFLERVGQSPVEVKDSPGFILNYFLIPFQNDCIRLIETGYSTPADIDAGIRLGLGYKMGPMRLLDIEGLDIHRTVALSLYEQFKDPRYMPPPLVDRMIAAGRLGTRTGRGFYSYKKPGIYGVAEPDEAAAEQRDISLGKPICDAIRKVGVVGLGAMGSGIAQVCATAGLEVFSIEANEGALEAGMGRVKKNLEGAVARGKIEDFTRKEILGRFHGSTDLGTLADCDFIIEVVVENMAVKLEMFEKLEQVAKADAILASNTSCLSVTAMAAKTKRPDRVLGMHFFNPPYAMRLVEVIEAVQTAPEIAQFGIAFCQRIGKTPILVKDRPGFLVNLLLVPYLNQAAQAFDEGLATREAMDKAVHGGLGHPMGPLTLLDLVGIDVAEFVADAMAVEMGGSRYVAPPILRRMTSAGWLGRKSGKGFYDYTSK